MNKSAFLLQRLPRAGSNASILQAFQNAHYAQPCTRRRRPAEFRFPLAQRRIITTFFRSFSSESSNDTTTPSDDPPAPPPQRYRNGKLVISPSPIDEFFYISRQHNFTMPSKIRRRIHDHYDGPTGDVKLTKAVLKSLLKTIQQNISVRTIRDADSGKIVDTAVEKLISGGMEVEDEGLLREIIKEIVEKGWARPPYDMFVGREEVERRKEELRKRMEESEVVEEIEEGEEMVQDKGHDK